MVRAIIFKEWLKVRWAYAGVLVVALVVLADIALGLRHEFAFEKATSIWSALIFRGSLFFAKFRYVPALAGLIIAVAQFVPEAISSRLKLSLHLPVRENTVVLQMLAVGVGCLLALEILTLALLLVLTSIYFPSEVVHSVLTTTLPWFLSGLSIYFAVAAIILEPKWWRRAVVIVLGYGVVQTFLVKGRYDIYTPSMQYLVVIVLLWSVAGVFSAYRFRRGVR